jgi:hypothetical protein
MNRSFVSLCLVLFILPSSGILHRQASLQVQPGGDTALLAPIPAGEKLYIYHGYNDPVVTDPTKCPIGSSLDHCANQKYGLDLLVKNQSEKRILAPLPGIIAWPDTTLKDAGDCLGIKTEDNLNLTICHFGNFAVKHGDQVKRGEVLGTRSTGWIHLSLDDGDYSKGKLRKPIEFSGSHTIERISFPSDGTQNQVFGNLYITSTNVLVEESGSSTTDRSTQVDTSWWGRLWQSVTTAWIDFWRDVRTGGVVQAGEGGKTLTRTTIEPTMVPTSVYTPQYNEELNRSDFISVAKWVHYSITHDQPDMIADVIGPYGTKFWGFAMGANPMGYNNAYFIKSELRKGIEGSSPQCLGYYLEDVGTKYLAAYLIFKDINFDWVRYGMGKPENDTVIFDFAYFDGGYELFYICPLPNSFWTDYKWNLTECP